jgi:hypothetical protein
MKISEMNDMDAAAVLLKSYRAACDCHDGESIHPAVQVNGWIRAARDARAKDAAGSGLGARELEERDQPKAGDEPTNGPAGAADDPAEFPGKPPNPQRGKPAQDSRPDWQLTEAEKLQRDYARRTNPAAVASMVNTIPSYGRLR